MNNLSKDFCLSKNSEKDRVYSIFESAVLKNASDIHIRGDRDEVIIKLRVNGKLETLLTFNGIYKDRFFNELQLMANIGIGNIYECQEGRINYKKLGVQFRYAQTPCLADETYIVLRVLKNDGRPTLSSVGYDVEDVQKIKKYLSMKSGLVCIAGATGSGKTTSLHAFVNEIIKSNKNIISVEDPVEYRNKEIAQIEIRENYNFKKVVRQMLRLDPDVIVIGEVRDEETAKACIDAASTGHLVLTTVHSSSINSVLSRFESLGVKKSNIEDVKTLYVHQSLLFHEDSVELIYELSD